MISIRKDKCIAAIVYVVLYCDYYLLTSNVIKFLISQKVALGIIKAETS